MRLLSPLLIVAVSASAAARPAHRRNFRVENAVYAENQQQAESRTVTIFAGGLVYDFLEQPPEAIVLDQAAGHFTLLDLQRRVTELSTEEVAAFSEKLKQRVLSDKEDPLRKTPAHVHGRTQV